MTSMARSLLLLSLSWSLASSTPAQAADDLTPLQDAPLTMPTPVPPMPGPAAAPPSFYRPNRMDVWQHFGVDRRGHWVPRVTLTGEGAFYYTTGMPYPVSVNQQAVMPYLLD
jgi:hypothetical protein